MKTADDDRDNEKVVNFQEPKVTCSGLANLNCLSGKPMLLSGLGAFAAGDTRSRWVGHEAHSQ
jgi:hypothetical protein